MTPGALTQPEIRAVVDNWHWRAINRTKPDPSDLTIRGDVGVARPTKKERTT